MATIVTLDVFSGRPNPTWLLPDDHHAKLTERLNAVQQPTAQKASGVLGGLGYRGFTVRHTPDSPALHSDFHVHEGIIDKGLKETNLISQDRELESWLLTTAGDAIPNEVRAHVEAEIKKPAAPAAELFRPPVPVKCPHCYAVDAVPYNPGKWNIPSVQPHNNCYNYANDHITNTFAQPGRAHGKQYTALSCPGVDPAAVADGLVNTANFTTPLAAGHGWYVALVIWPNVDYHWYRQDNVGCWSHKPGSTAARNTDNSGKPITDPKTCNRGTYTVFCTYMITKRTVVIH